MALAEELMKLKKDLEVAQSEKIRLETQLQILEKEITESLGTCDPDKAKEIIQERRDKVEASKQEIQEGISKIHAENPFLNRASR